MTQSTDNNFEIKQDNMVYYFAIIKDLIFAFMFPACAFFIYLLFPSHILPIDRFFVSFFILCLFYSVFKISMPFLIKIFYKKIPFKIEDIYISQSRSYRYDYFVLKYYPFIKYSYNVNKKQYFSENISFDKKSLYGTLIKEKSLDNSKDTLLKLSKKNYMYCNPILASNSYLDINLSKNRYIYFSLIGIISFFAIIFITFFHSLGIAIVLKTSLGILTLLFGIFYLFYSKDTLSDKFVFLLLDIWVAFQFFSLKY